MSDDTLQTLLDEMSKLRELEFLSNPDITQADFSARGSLWLDGYMTLWQSKWADSDRRHQLHKVHEARKAAAAAEAGGQP